MSDQKRLIDYGSTVRSEQIADIVSTLNDSGLLTKEPVIVESEAVIRLQPFSVITPDGVVIIENESTIFTLSLTAAAKQYTLVMRHSQTGESGGTAAVLELLDNYQALGSVENAVVICWLDYPGSSVALSEDMLYFPEPLKNVEGSSSTNLIFSVTPPMSGKWLRATTLLPDLSIETKFDGLKVYEEILNTSTVINTSSTYYIPVVIGAKPPTAMFVNGKADFQSAMTFSIITENGTEIYPTQNIIANTDWGIFGMKLPNQRGLSSFKPYESITIKIRIALNPGKQINLASISLTDYPLPITSLSGSGSADVINYPYDFVRLASVIDFYNPSVALPVSPNHGDRYIAQNTNNGWTQHRIYTYDITDVWVEHIPTEGEVINVTNTDVDYVFNGNRWVSEIPAHHILV